MTPPSDGRRTITTKYADGRVVEREYVPDRTTFDDWVREMEAKKTPSSPPRNRHIAVTALDASLMRVDLRALPSTRFRIVGSEFYVKDHERADFGGSEYVLVREPENEHDANAVAVYGKGRKIGHLSAAKAKSLAPELDRLGPAGFVVTGEGTSANSIRMWVDVPSIVELRRFNNG